MKNVFWISAALLLLAACGTEEPAPTATETASGAAQEALETVAAETTAETDPADEVLEVVEESASENVPEEQAIVLAQAETAVATQDWQFKENQHYFRLVPTQPTVGGADKIEVAEFFMYSCPHCFDFEPTINAWAAQKPANVRFVRVPVMWNLAVALHAQLYYTAEVLARNGTIKDQAAFHESVFTEYHRRGNRLASEASIQALFARFDVSEEEFQRTWKSFEVSQKMRVAEDLTRRYGVDNVPTIVVNGKYRTGGSQAGSYPKLLEVIDELVVRESAR